MENKIRDILKQEINGQTLKKIILSKSINKEILRVTIKPFLAKEQLYLQLETFCSDGKAIHKNLVSDSCIEFVVTEIFSSFKQCNIISTGGSCEIKRSKNDKITVINKIKGGEKIVPKQHNRIKKTILNDKESYPFLIELGISDKNGRIYDKRRAKYNQINRFLEIIDDIYPKLPQEGTLTICDLCCGKSYLTFAAYHYFTSVKNRTVDMYGVDLKADVIDYCSSTAEKLGYSSLKFLNSDISKFNLPKTDMVLSLHACDIATDIVLANAVRMNATIILSTPCCHREMSGQIECEDLSFITKHSMLKQKLCETATDSLRALRLEAEGYKVTALELIDPENTPKNLLLRCEKRNISLTERERIMDEYTKIKTYLGVNPYLNILLTETKNNG